MNDSGQWMYYENGKSRYSIIYEGDVLKVPEN